MIKIYESNDLNILKKNFLEFLKNNPLNNIWETEIILSQYSTTNCWLEKEITECLEINFNINFFLIKVFIKKIILKLFKYKKHYLYFNSISMQWKLMDIILNNIHNPVLKDIKNYLNRDYNQENLFFLSKKIVNLFNKYLIYRPEWIVLWEKGKDINILNNTQIWQKYLWNKLYNNKKKSIEKNVYIRFLNYLQNNKFLKIQLPKRIFIWNPIKLAPIYYQIINALNQHIKIYIFFYKPIYQFIDMKNIKYNYNNNFFLNPLIKSCIENYRQTEYFFSKFKKKINIRFNIEIDKKNLLKNIQYDFLYLKNKYKNNINLKKRKINSNDQSITFHSCSSKKIEIEVLYNYILNILNNNINVEPKDIIVVLPNINTYIPYINSIFNNPNNLNQKILFSIFDEIDKKTYAIFQTFLLILKLPESRCTNEEIINFLEISYIGNKFSIYEKDISLLKEIVKYSGIRYGLDQKHIKELKLPKTEKNTWQFGLNRILLGLTIDQNIGQWKNIIPYNNNHQKTKELVGNLHKFIEKIKQWKFELKKNRNFLKWLPICKKILKTFFVCNQDTQKSLIYIRKKWNKIINNGIQINYSNKISVSTIFYSLNEIINQKINKSNIFMKNNIVFCDFSQIHSISFKIICILGMNYPYYPQVKIPCHLNLINQKPKISDHNQYDNECNLFLNLLSIASKEIYLSYISYSKNKKKKYPSVLFESLLNYIIDNFFLERDIKLDDQVQKKRIKKFLFNKHSQLPFDKNVSLSNTMYQNYFKTSIPIIKKKKNYQTNIKKIEKISLKKIIKFYQHPIKTYFQESLKINFDIPNIQLDNEEPFFLNNLEKYHFNKKLLEYLLNGKPIKKIFSEFQKIGFSPLKNFGKIYLEKEIHNIMLLIEKIKKKTLNNKEKVFKIKSNSMKIFGKIKNIYQNGIIHYRTSNLTINDGILLWIEHLIYCSFIKPKKSYFFGINNTEWCFYPIYQHQAIEYLKELIYTYKIGMQNPFIFLKQSGWSWLKSFYKKKDQSFDFQSKDLLEKANIKLMTKLEGNKYQQGEINDIYIQRLYQNINNNLIQQIKKNAYTYLFPMFFFKKK
ncbi:MAG: exodeoxyribonuclease V subunit gamma [Arsenophonus sp.]|nr:MAG: exodeoxyribonuclease V subunit gamma [Arsenophonus sp.]